MKGTLLPPDKAKGIPNNAKWLPGEGAGAWFVLEKQDEIIPNQFRLRRYSDTGELHCDKTLIAENGNFDPERAFTIKYPSHCKFCTIEQDNDIIILNSVS